MLKRLTFDKVGHFSANDRRYWLLQLFGWSALTVLSYLSLTIWYNPGQWIYTLHTVVQSFLGLVISHPLRYIARGTWQKSATTRILANGLGIITASILWTWLRLLTLEWITGERVGLSDVGGWLNASVIVFGAWSFVYHALKYYPLSLEQRELALVAQRQAAEAREEAQAEMVRRLQAESSFREAQMRMLQYQLSPHFLFNALNSVTSRVQKGESDKAVTMLAKIAAFLRVSLEQDDRLQHSLAEEIEAVKLYLEIEKTRFGDRMHTEFVIAEEALPAQLPGLLLQPLLENAIKYAVGNSLATTTIRIEAWVENDWLELRVSDTGPGFRPGAPIGKATSTGIGLKNVEERLRSANGDFYRFVLEPNDPRGTMVALAFPFTSRSVIIDRSSVDDHESA